MSRNWLHELIVTSHTSTMPVPKPTSTILAEILKRLERQKLLPAPSNPIIKAIQEDIVGVAERLMTPKEAANAARMLLTWSGVEWLLDDALSRILVAQLPKVVKRSMSFDVSMVTRSVPSAVEAYLREAAQAFIFGLNNAAVALCRSALEEALKGCVPRKLVTKWELSHLLNAAEKSKTLSPSRCKIASDVQRLAGNVLHGSSVNSQQARDALAKTRLVLEALYGR